MSDIKARRLSGFDLGKIAEWSDADGWHLTTIAEVHHYADTGSTFIGGSGGESYYLEPDETVSITETTP